MLPKEVKNQEFKIDFELKSLLPDLTEQERSQLEENLVKNPSNPTITIWKEKNTIIDGHNVYEICQEKGIKFSVNKLSFSDRASVKEWMLKNQLGRRNLTKRDCSYYQGCLYNLQKETRGGDRKSKGRNCTLKNTAEELAKEFDVSPRLIKENGQYAKAVDAIAKDRKMSVEDVKKTLNKTEAIKHANKILSKETSGVQVRLQRKDLQGRTREALSVDGLAKVISTEGNPELVGHKDAFVRIVELTEHGATIQRGSTIIENVNQQFLSPYTEKVYIKVDPLVCAELLKTGSSLFDEAETLLKRALRKNE